MAATSSFLDCKRKFSARSDRVKSLEFHPTEPWLLSALYNGHVYIWNYNTQSLAKDIEVTNYPVRVAKFVVRKQWVISGADDMKIRVHNYNTLENVKAFEAHQDYIRSIAVHPTLPYVLSSSDDMMIKLWDWEKGWMNTKIFEGHNHYVMMIAFNPKDTNTFASASLDRTIKVWGLGSPVPFFTLEGHEQGVNCVAYYLGGERPYLVSGGDDRTVRIWDYQNKACVQVLTGHTHNVSAVTFHPSLPLLISGSEDGSVRLWHSSTYKLEKTLHYRMERVWCLACMKTSNKIGFGYDEGVAMVKLGSEEPAVSMDRGGKIVWSKHNEIKIVNVKNASGAEEDGEKLPLPPKDLGSCEMYPRQLAHNSSGRFVVACGGGEYVIYTSLKWRNKAFGRGLEFVWAKGTGDYAVLESKSKIKMYKNFKETNVFRPSFTADGIHAGELLGVRSQNFICFYDWDTGCLVRRVDVAVKSVMWSDDGDLVTIASEDAFYILRYNRNLIQERMNSGVQGEPEEGFDDAFEVEQQIEERVRTGSWVGACFVYTSGTNRLNYVVGKEIVTIAHLDRQQYLLGYLAKTNRLYLIDKSLTVTSYTLHLSIVNYQTAVLNGQLEVAASILPKIPLESRNRIARFLEAQGLKEEALEVATDPDLKFELAVALNQLQIAFTIAQEADSEQKWHTLGDLAVQQGRFGLAQKCMLHADDLAGLLLLYTSTGHANALGKLAERANQQGKHNLSFVAYLLLQRTDRCLEILLSANRIPEAAFFARTYLPSEIPRVLAIWKQELGTDHAAAAEALADPVEYPNLFPEYELARKAEQIWKANSKPVRAAAYQDMIGSLDRDLLAEAKTVLETGGKEEETLAEADQPQVPAAAAATNAESASSETGNEKEKEFTEPLVAVVENENETTAVDLQHSEEEAASPVVEEKGEDVDTEVPVHQEDEEGDKMVAPPSPIAPTSPPLVATSPVAEQPLVDTSDVISSPAPLPTVSQLIDVGEESSNTPVVEKPFPTVSQLGGDLLGDELSIDLNGDDFDVEEEDVLGADDF